MLTKVDKEMIDILKKEGTVSTTKMTKLMNMRRKHVHKMLHDLAKIGEIIKLDYTDIKKPEKFEKSYYDYLRHKQRNMIGIITGNYWRLK